MTGGNAAAGFMATVVVGGTVSELSGGKFANGAKTAAYQFLFNQMGSLKTYWLNKSKEWFDSPETSETAKNLLRDQLYDELKSEYNRLDNMSDSDYSRKYGGGPFMRQAAMSQLYSDMLSLGVDGILGTISSAADAVITAPVEMLGRGGPIGYVGRVGVETAITVGLHQVNATPQAMAWCGSSKGLYGCVGVIY